MRETKTCPIADCRNVPNRIVKAGTFLRKDDAKRIQRFQCKNCGKGFSAATGTLTFRQKKRRINVPIRGLFAIKVSHRATARYLKINRKTVMRRLYYWAARATLHFDQMRWKPLLHVQFDELQSSIHTKCKPVAIPIAVDAETRTILALSVASMPAQHPLKEIALKKYGPRQDDRPKAIAAVLTRIEPMLDPKGIITTDMAPRYPSPIRRILPGRKHIAHRSRRAGVGGQGELKKIGFDPLFSLNHTAAMIRDGVSRLVRKTWGNSKRMDHLEAHLKIYAHYHNTKRLRKIPAML